MTFPPLKHFGPLLVVWGAAMLMLVFIRDLGSSLMFFGGFLAVLYVATNRLSFVVVGLGAVRARRLVLGLDGQPRAGPRRHLAGPVRPRAGSSSEGYQIAQWLFAQADGGLFGTGFGAGAAHRARAATPILPAPHTDLIYAVIVNELGLAGACGLILVYLLLRRARLQDRDARARLVLQAAGRRA